MGLGLGSQLKRFDLFPSPIPGFNINGRDALQTGAGGLISFCIVYISFIFAFHKLMHMLERHNPQVNSYVNYDAFNFDDVFDIKEQNFRMAFAVEQYLTGDILSDLRYFKWFAQYQKTVNGTRTSTEIPMHTCSEDDFANFDPVNASS